MHRCFLLPVALSAQLVIFLCCAVSAFPTLSARRSLAPSSSSSSVLSQVPDSGEEDMSDLDDLRSTRFKPKLLTLLQLGLLSSSTSPRVDGWSHSSAEDSISESEEDARLLEQRQRPSDDDSRPGMVDKRKLVLLHKKAGGLSLNRGDGPPRLSIVNPLDVLRQKMLLEVLRAKNETTQRIVDENARIMEHLGKRSAVGRSVIRPSRQRLNRMLNSLVSGSTV